MENHNITDNYIKGLDKLKYKKKPSEFREEMKKQFPELNNIGINALLSEDWKRLTAEEKALYKPPRASSPVTPAWLKVKSILWPCKSVVTGRVQLINDTETIMDVSDTELKPFDTGFM